MCCSLDSYFAQVLFQWAIHDTGWPLSSGCNQNQNIDVIRTNFDILLEMLATQPFLESTTVHGLLAEMAKLIDAGKNKTQYLEQNMKHFEGVLNKAEGLGFMIGGGVGWCRNPSKIPATKVGSSSSIKWGDMVGEQAVPNKIAWSSLLQALYEHEMKRKDKEIEKAHIANNEFNMIVKHRDQLNTEVTELREIVHDPRQTQTGEVLVG